MRLPMLAAVLVLSALAAGPGRAETPEEAVAYVFMGLADGAAITRGQTMMSWKETAPSPATFESQSSTAGRTYQIRFTVTAEDPCTYQIVLEGPRTVVPTGKAVYARVDLARVTGVTVADHAVKAYVAGDGFCETGSMNPTCMKLDTSDLFGSVDVAKHKATVAFLGTGCPAPAE